MSIRELVGLATAKMRYDWCHTSSLMALYANCHRDPDSDAFGPADFNPMLPKRKAKRVTMPFGDLKKALFPGED